MPDVIDYRRGPDAAERDAAQRLAASWREALIPFFTVLIIALSALLVSLGTNHMVAPKDMS
jgi:hypothetical protein